MRGRKPTPTILHELRGTTNVTRHANRVNEPQAPGDALNEPPDWLSDSQKEGWRFAIAYAPRNLLKPIDRTVLIIWVEAEDRHRRATEAQAGLDRRNPGMQMVLPRSRGKDKGTELVESPYIRILSRAAETLLKAVSQLGFSPAARPRLSGSAPEPTSPTDPWARVKALQSGTSISTTTSPPGERKH